jgi:uncharacterized protein YajQ (UPF0234 family)
MPSFDIVSEIDQHELTNAVDQTSREISTRFDFKGSDAKIELKGSVITLEATGDFQIKQIHDILYNKLIKRGIDTRCLEPGNIGQKGLGVHQDVTVKEGIDKEQAKKVVKKIKDSKMKVQAAIQGEQVRVTGKKRDDLQQVMSMLKESDLDFPLQFNNFRD